VWCSASAAPAPWGDAASLHHYCLKEKLRVIKLDYEPQKQQQAGGAAA
jgi:hypothetical protein